MKRLSIAISLLIPFALGCASSQQQPANSNNQIATSAPSAEKAASKDIVDTAVGAGNFQTLVAALQSAELVDALKGEGPFTVFAPSDEAFAQLPAGTVEALLQDKEKLTKILTYHVVPGRVLAAEVSGLDSAKTLQGQSVEIDTSNGVKVGEARVIATDIVASNGVIHVIDKVLIPN